MFIIIYSRSYIFMKFMIIISYNFLKLKTVTTEFKQNSPVNNYTKHQEIPPSGMKHIFERIMQLLLIFQECLLNPCSHQYWQQCRKDNFPIPYTVLRRSTFSVWTPYIKFYTLVSSVFVIFQLLFFWMKPKFQLIYQSGCRSCSKAELRAGLY